MPFIHNLRLRIIRFFTPLPSSYREEFALDRFSRNNLRILILGTFLFFEQLVYALFVSPPGTTEQCIYYVSALLMFLFIFPGSYFLLRPPETVRTIYRVYEYSLGFIGMAVALIRILLLGYAVFRVPTIYIAVLYGVAVIFLYNYTVSFILYFLLSLSAILLIPQFHELITSSSYIADISSNGFIAWIVSALNYKTFKQLFLDKKTIEEQNRELTEKNRQIETANWELKEQSIRDGLTSLYNRRKLDQVLKDVHGKAERYGEEFSLIILDIDYFKKINDTYGHDTGDRVLVELAKILSDNIREVDTCGRWGGEEFLIILPQTDMQQAHLLAERLRATISSTIFAELSEVTASFGIAEYSKESNLETIIKTADSCLYRAKEEGRNRVVSQ